MSICDIFNQTNIDISIGGNSYIIPVKELLIKKNQRYIIRKRGIANVNIRDIFNIKNRADICIDIKFTDIE